MKLGSKEFYELMETYERYMHLDSSDRENKSIWERGYYYKNGYDDKGFKTFIAGYQHAKSLARIDSLILND